MKFIPLIFLLLCGCASTPQPPRVVGRGNAGVAPLSTINPQPSATITPVCGECHVSWSPPVNDDPELIVTNYNLYLGLSSRQYQFILPTAGETNGVVEGLANAPYYFAVTAIYQTGQESDFSEETQFTPSLRLQLHFPHQLSTTNYQLESSTDLATWSLRDSIATNGDWLVTATNGPQEFYREKQ